MKRHSSLAAYFLSSRAMSRAEAAQAWGVTEATVSRWVTGARTPRGEQAIRVSEDTGVPLAVLIGKREAA